MQGRARACYSSAATASPCGWSRAARSIDWPPPTPATSSSSPWMEQSRLLDANPRRERTGAQWGRFSLRDEVVEQLQQPAGMGPIMALLSSRSRIDTEALKRERPLADVIASYGVALRREGSGTYRGLCP